MFLYLIDSSSMRTYTEYVSSLLILVPEVTKQRDLHIQEEDQDHITDKKLPSANINEFLHNPFKIEEDVRRCVAYHILLHEMMHMCCIDYC